MHTLRYDIPRHAGPRGENELIIVDLTWVCLQLNCCCDSQSSYSYNRSFPSRPRFPIKHSVLCKYVVVVLVVVVIVVVVVVVVSHIQRIGCQPEKLLYTVANPARGLLNRKTKKNKKSGSASPHPHPPPPPGALLIRRKIKNKTFTRRIHMSRRYEGRRYAGGLGPSRVRTRIPTTRRLGQWVSLRTILRFREQLQLFESRCLSLLPVMSGRVFLFFPPRGHESPPTLRDRLNPNLSF